jgi:tetratricopeptide (TPR) repeat protein
LLLSRAAVGAWYNKQPLQALALASMAASENTDNGEILNTVSALLNLCGFPQKSIPILQSLLVKAPGNSTVLNNLGQAYLSLGETQKAEQYLLQCVAASQNHVEANKSLAMIYRATGQAGKAKACLQRSLEGGSSETAVEMAKEAGISDEVIDDMIIKSVKTVKAPEYFNSYKYQVPQLCESVQQAYEASENHKKFQAFIEAEIKKYERLAKEEEEKINKNIEKITGPVRNGQLVRFVPSPMFEKGKRMFSYWLMKFGNFAEKDLGPAYIKYSIEEQALTQQYYQDYAAINMRKDNADHCPAFDELATRYLQKYAANQRNLMDIMLIPYRGYMDEMIYWSQFMNVVGDGRARIYGLIKEYLNELLRLSRQTKIIFPSCKPTPVFEFTGEEAETIKPDCPIDVSINLVIAEMSLDCEKIGFEVSAGVKFSVEKDFTSKETTLAIGIGIGTGKEFEVPVIGIEAGVGVSQEMFLVFDGNNNVSDIGMRMEAGAKIEAGGSLGPVSTEIGSIGASAGYSFGLNSGWNFNGSVPGIPGNLLN